MKARGKLLSAAQMSEVNEGKERRTKGCERQTRRQERGLLITWFLSPCCVAFGKIFIFSEPQLPHLQNGDGSDSVGLLGDRSEILPAGSRGRVN